MRLIFEDYPSGSVQRVDFGSLLFNCAVMMMMMVFFPSLGPASLAGLDVVL
jgi:hypothetical protein